MTRTKRTRVTVLIDDNHRTEAASVISRMNKRGFEIDREGNLEAIGVVVGSIPRQDLGALKDIEGVGSVEEERTDYTIQPRK